MTMYRQMVKVATATVVMALAASMMACGAEADDAERVSRVQSLLPTLVVERVSESPVAGPIEGRVRLEVRGFSDVQAHRQQIAYLGEALHDAANDANDATAANDANDDVIDEEQDTAADDGGASDGDDAIAGEGVAGPMLPGCLPGEACTTGFDCLDFVCFSAGAVVDSAPGSCSSPEGLRLAPGACYDDADCGGAHCEPSGLVALSSSLMVTGECIGDTTFFPGTCTTASPQ